MISDSPHLLLPIDPTRRRSSRFSWWIPACGILGLVLLRVLPLPRDGAIAGLPSPCGWYHLTGQPCPLCGLTRSLVYAAHGSFSDAAWWHPIGPAVLFGIVAAVAWAALKVLCPDRVSELSPSSGKQWGITGVALMLVLWMARLSGWIPSPF